MPTHYTFEEFVAANDMPDDERYEYSECGECKGKGQIKCDCGYHHHCEECDGTGKIKNDLLRGEYNSMCYAQDRAWESWHKGVKA